MDIVINYRSDYYTSKDKAQKLYYSYTGDKSKLVGLYSDGYIQQHKQESNTSYAKRKDRAVVVNTMQYFLDTLINAVFTNDVDYKMDEQNEKIKRLILSATPDNRKLEEIMREVITISEYMDCVIMIDTFSEEYKQELGVNPNMPTVADVKKWRLFPYIQLVKDWDIVNYELDIYGEIKQLLVKTTMTEKSDGFQTSNDVTYYYYYSQSKNWVARELKSNITSSEIKATIISENDNTLGYVPAIFIKARNESKYINVANNQKSISNIYSTMEQKGLDSAFGFLATEVSMYDQDLETTKKQLYNKTENTNLIEFEKSPPQWVEKKADDILNLRELLKEQLHIDQFQFWLDITDENSMFAMSGRAMEIGRKSLSEALKKISEIAETITNKIIDIVSEIESVDFVPVVYPSRFEIETTAEKINNIETAIRIYGSQSEYVKYLKLQGMIIMTPDVQDDNEYDNIVADVNSGNNLTLTI